MSDWATFGAGCFWGVEAAFRKLPGVLDAAVGYSGGNKVQPSYQEVCTDQTGHAEVVRVEFDPKLVSYERLLEVFFKIHDPTQVNRQGPDVGSQYRSVIFTHSAEQMKLAEAAKQKLEESRRFSMPVATIVEAAGPFWMAEDYHQRYHEKHGGACHF
jgi:peptide-methionine (S)-S-oxide reductase